MFFKKMSKHASTDKLPERYEYKNEISQDQGAWVDATCAGERGDGLKTTLFRWFFVDRSIENNIPLAPVVLKDGEKVTDRFCRRCWCKVDENDRYCRGCGQRLKG